MKNLTNSKLCHHYLYNLDHSQTTNRSLYSKNEYLYSYGAHYLLALRGQNKNGKNWIIINDSRYSNTTAKHCSNLRQAVPNTFEIFNFNPKLHEESKIEVLEYYYNNIVDLLNQAKRSRTNTSYLIKCAYLKSKELKTYYEFFNSEIDKRKIKKPIKLVLNSYDIRTDCFKELFVTLNDKAEDQRIKAIIKERQRYEKNKERLEKQLIKFRNFEISNISVQGNSYLRIKDNSIQTSQGLEFSVAECQFLYNCLKAGKCKDGMNVTLAGQSYFLKEYNDKFLHIGCHKFEISEVEHIASELDF